MFPWLYGQLGASRTLSPVPGERSRARGRSSGVTIGAIERPDGETEAFNQPKECGRE